MKIHSPNSVLLATLLASAALLGACDRAGEGTTTGAPPDGVVSRTDRDAGTAAREATSEVREAGREVASEAREAGREAGQAIGNATDTMVDKTRDAAITTAIKAKLAADERLSALDINVDTSNGQVVLRGAAPDTDSRNRATELARTVDGVGDVNNQLSVQPRQ